MVNAMKRLAIVLVLLVVWLVSSLSLAEVPNGPVDPKNAPDSMTMQVGFGLGWHICKPDRPLPDLATAFDCSGLRSDPDPITVTMTRQRTQKPEWLLYSGEYRDRTSFAGNV